MKEFIIRDLQINKKSYVLQFLSIAFSVALAMGILILHGTMSNRIAQLSDTEGVEATITATFEDNFGMDLVQLVAEIPSVVNVNFRLEYSAETDIHGRARTLWLLGIDSKTLDADKVKIIEGRTLEFGSGQYEILVDNKVAGKENISIGDEIIVPLKGKKTKYTVVGIYRKNRFSMQPCYEFYVDGGKLQKELKEAGKYNKINVVTADQQFQTVSRVTGEMKKITLDSVTYETIIDRRWSASKDLSSFSMILWAVLAILVLGSAYLIYNSFCVRMEERINTIAMLKTLGAKGQQIKTAFLKEGLFLGFLGSVAGIAAGIGVGLCLCYLYAEKDSSEVGPYLTIKFLYAAGCILVGLIVCYIGSVRPIQKASKLSPVAAMRNGASQQYKRQSLKRQKVKLVIGLMVLALMLILSNQVVLIESEEIVYTAMVFLGIGTVAAMVMIMPYMVVLICKLTLRFATKNNKAELYLASENLANNRNHTTLLISIVITGIMIIVSLHGMFSSARGSVGEYVTEAFAHDYLLDSAIANPAELENGIKQMKDQGVLKDYTSIQVYNYMDAESGKSLRIFGVNPGEISFYSKLKLYAKDKSINFETLDKNNNVCFVSRQIMLEKGYHLGDTIEFDCNGEPLKLQIAAYFSSFTNSGRLIYMSKKNLKIINKDSYDTLFCLNKVESVSNESFETAVRDIMPVEKASLLAVDVFRTNWKNDVIKGTEIFYVIFAMITVFVFFSIINNYIASILQRKKEVGVLASLGARDKSIRSIFINEMILMFLVIVVFGTAGSYATLYIFVKCLSAVFHADLNVYYPIGIMAAGCILLILIFIIMNCVVIQRIRKTNQIQIIKERTI